MKILLKGIHASDNSNKLTSFDLKQKENEENFNISNIKTHIIESFKEQNEDIINRDFSLFSNGKFLIDNDSIQFTNNQIIEIKFTLLGGKVKIFYLKKI